MKSEALILFALGMMFIIGLICDRIGKNTPIPRVSLLLFSGVIIGPSGLNLIPRLFIDSWFGIITDIALAMVGFLLGSKMSPGVIKSIGKQIVFIAFGVVMVTVVFVGIVLFLTGIPIIPAVLLSTIAIATAPAATMDVVEEVKADNKFSKLLLGIVAIDDAFGLILFSLAAAFCYTLGTGGGVVESLTFGLWEITGACFLGTVFGLLMTLVNAPDYDNEAVQAKAMGMVMLCAGSAIWLGVSYILSTIVLGFVLSRRRDGSKVLASEVGHLEWPFMILFFILAGASLNLEALMHIGWIGPSYIFSRIFSSVTGGWFGAKVSRCDPQTCRWIGLALMPQAGVAIGMALMATHRFPQYANLILPVVIGATVFFELAGPFFTRIALRHTA